jgi:hypothetical protein
MGMDLPEASAVASEYEARHHTEVIVSPSASEGLFLPSRTVIYEIPQ